MPDSELEFNAWNPGLSSDIPAALLPRVTLYDSKNTDTRYQDAKDAANFCGLKPHEMVLFKVSRLAMHEVLIRVTADLHVPDGPNYADLGLSLRRMASQILTHHVTPKMAELEHEYDRNRQVICDRLSSYLDADVYGIGTAPKVPQKRAFKDWIFGKKPDVKVEQAPPELLALTKWQAEASVTEVALDLACLKALQIIVGGIIGRRGRLVADKDLIVKLASILVCNAYGSRRIGALVDPILCEAAQVEGYRLLPYQAEPFVMNVKGASAAGKSTIRPLQRKLAMKIGVNWEDFALISPDYWRKFMLDYESIGKAYKYAAMLTGQELEIIDKKLDGYMADKAARREMPHLLIDRFRFDSFDPSRTNHEGGRLLSRFGHTVFMYFVITPPTETVERAWKRGKTTGRYKAVDDLLYHNIEAYTGMPELFLNWVNKKKQKVHFEFLDNDVPLGDRPKTVAFGWNGKITILNSDCMRRLNRYKHINVDALRPEDAYLEVDEDEQDLLLTFIENIPNVTFVDPISSEVCAQIHHGKCFFEVPGFLKGNALEVIGHNTAAGDRLGQPQNTTLQNTGLQESETLTLHQEEKYTIGAWGGDGRR
ncbi:zeta toxin family protein [Paracoccaceae bacterium]|nr:zeta toxin family protein [Paracoccaceae bacterium]